MTVSEEKLAVFIPIIERVARNVSAQHHVVEFEDLQQELLLFVIQRGDSLPAPSEIDWSMKSLLTRVAKMYAFQQKNQHYLIDSRFSYEVKDVKDILLLHFDQSNWDTVRDGQNTEDALAEHSDVAWALDRLSPDDKAFVAECYAKEKLPSSRSKEYRKLRDVVIKIANILNHYTRSDEGNGPGRRKVMSNAQSRAVIDVETHFYGGGSSTNHGMN